MDIPLVENDMLVVEPFNVASGPCPEIKKVSSSVAGPEPPEANTIWDSEMVAVAEDTVNGG